MLLISLSCYLLENYSWSFTHLWTKPHGGSSALRHRPWAPCHAVGSSQARVKRSSSPHAPLCPRPSEGTGGLLHEEVQVLQGGSCFLGQGGPTVWLLSHENEVRSKVVLSVGRLARVLPGVQEAAAPVLPSARDPCLAQLSSGPTTAEARGMLSSSFPFCPA